jgi:hypothetical protein
MNAASGFRVEYTICTRRLFRIQHEQRVVVISPQDVHTSVVKKSAATISDVHLWAISRRYQHRIVSGVTRVATCLKTWRPSRWPFAAE